MPSVTVSGASGMIGRRLVAELLGDGWDVTILSREPERARRALGDVRAHAWDPVREPAPAGALAGRDAVAHLAGEPVAQRWSPEAKTAIRDSRVTGTENLLAGLRDAEPRPRALVSSSAVGYYGARGIEPIDEEAGPGGDFLADVCVAWEGQAERAAKLGLRVVRVRTGVVLDRGGGALAKMLLPFQLGIGGPVAGGRQYIPWIHSEDVVGMFVAALGDERWQGAVNGSAPGPVTNREFSHALGRALHRPAILPVPGIALRALYGEMAQIVTGGVRAVPARPLVLGYSFRHPELDEALRSALAR
ncbi:MAG TPA: TIGR01777 family oxidoreductase [Solirubrobacteraceae bacterium]|jgi:uncharacterized protein (TIGR01777 family)|nr:TIGR01777 family oxidoreductase [Solirubrobacteraceae bacterium]